jgi:hypothetical protein
MSVSDPRKGVKGDVYGRLCGGGHAIQMIRG